ncbi:hypothetical protein BDY24DRAFT_385444 [Mrakia frigida]|uniref:uncharacterized protein n=1 Tax=Mrakia frigida TaxID=29902 RepID=UPI003FCC0936
MLPSSSSSDPQDDPEDVFSFFVDSLGEKPFVFTPNEVCYGEIRVTTAEKDGKAGILMADQFFTSGLALAEMVELGKIPVSGASILELGAASALPSFVSTTISPPPRSVLITDYPDETILPTLQKNVERNSHLAGKGCRIGWLPYEWGKEVEGLKSTLDDPEDKFDLIFLADLLWLTNSLPELLQTLFDTLSKTNPDAMIYFAAGSYTSPSSISHFFASAVSAGFVWEEFVVPEEWKGETEVKGLVEEEERLREGWREGLSVRKRGGRVRGFKMWWSKD